ncbi:MAG: sialate O-acetylesterase [Verrucomicrobia bacterium]|nr:sialate O-acetylesterase [Verrucomicrobiota bacterium]
MFLKLPARFFIRSLAALGALAACVTVFAQTPAKTYVVTEGAFPWFDRLDKWAWALSGVPESLLGTTPVPQQSCSDRSLVLTGTPSAIVLAVYDKDLAKFQAEYPAATPTGEKLGVKNPSGVILAYTVLSLVNPPQIIQTKSRLGSGLILLKVTDSGAPAQPAATAVPAVPAVPITALTPASGAAAQPAPRQAFVLPARQNVDLYLLLGQSNMVGRDTAGLEAQATDPRIGFVDGKGRWWVAREPMHSGGSGIGPGISFATAMLASAAPATVIGLIPCAVGGTPLSRWVKGGDLYEAAVRRAKTAAAAGRLKGILWHQGEGDSVNAADAQSYEVRLNQMFKDIRSDLGQPDLPIVVGQLGEFVQSRYVETVRIALTHLPASLPRVGFADSKGLGHKGDSLHFSTEAAQEMGRRYAAAMKAIP